MTDCQVNERLTGSPRSCDVGLSEYITGTDKSVMLPSLLIDVVSVLSGALNFVNNRPGNVFFYSSGRGSVDKVWKRKVTEEGVGES